MRSGIEFGQFLRVFFPTPEKHVFLSHLTSPIFYRQKAIILCKMNIAIILYVPVPPY